MSNLSKNSAHLLCAVFASLSLSACGGNSSEPVDFQNPGLSWPPLPTVTGHRGASALRPEHTLASYQRAIDDGADIVEPDLVATKDGVLVARHENEISGTTNVSTLPQFAARKTTKTIDGIPVTGWFTEDFTLAELKTIRAKERIPANRPANTAFDGQFEIPTLQEVIDLVKQQAKEKNRVIGIYPETKHPTYFKSIGLPLEKRLVDVLVANGYKGKNAAVFIQSFEVANLKELRGMTDMRLVQLVDNPLNPPVNGVPRNAPYDFIAAGSNRTYADLVKPAGLKEIAQYADAVSPYKEVIIPRDAKNELGAATSFVADAHAAGLKVHTWTLRPENPFLPPSMRLGDAASLTQRGDSIAEITAYLKAGIDGFFTDDPAVGRAAVTAFKK
ncbi:glycerophosphoryl diester phosphodiesterase [Undibacterium sp. KW1]|uniref:glycerophosphodiester phosphodiesterase n=1 Tax=Undibacterium sp. KW1 TaxID=2058624 RepID=UPI001331F75C|nr:glycerophosphodiester phosphodiesterase [Undibacterium sp. KW1]BBB64115.1 glycerophosphoryl diester phosphodiesterase [Undibacterium sp. KW1]